MTNIQSPKLTSPKLTAYEFKNLPLLGTTTTNQNVLLGGFSGLYFQGVADNGNLQFVTHTDRGPNGEPTGQNRPFLLPNFQPEIVSFELNKTTSEITITKRTKLLRADGKTPLTGLPNLQAGTGNTAYTDEIGVDLNGIVINNDPLGADLEGIVVTDNGHYWMVDEYRPAIYHFNGDGVLVNRFIPQGTAAKANQPTGTFGTELLPEVYAQRRNNRGFEAVALAGNKLYAFIQTPIDNPDSTGDTTSRNSRNLRILEFDIVSEKVTGEYLYLLDNITGSGNAKTDKIGDAVFLGGTKFAVVERDDRSDTTSNKLIYQIDLAGATNINDATKFTLPSGKTIEQLTTEELSAAGITPVNKSLIVNAAQIGYTGVEKLEGLALVSANTLAVVNDNDFITTIPEKLGIIELPNNLVEVTGTANKDELFVKKGEYVLGVDGDDILDASDGLGNNVLDGGAGNDQLYAGKSDTLIGGTGNDQLYVVEGNNNILYGGAGSDQLYVVEGNNNILYGEDGDDNLYIIEGGNNTLNGGGGADKFYIVNSAIPDVPSQVLDFTRGDDKVIISGISQIQSFDNLILEQNGNDTIIKTKDLIDGFQRVLGILKNVTANTLTADDFRINDNQAPRFTNPSATFSIDENTTAVGITETATDPDAGDTLTYKLEGADVNKFDFNPTTRALNFKTAPNFDSPGSAANSNTYTLILKATDNGNLSATQNITVNVVGINETPVFTNPSATFSIAEDTTAVGITETATDPDAGDTLTYKLEGADVNKFDFNPTTRALNFKTAPNFDSPGSAANSNTYTLILKATDNGNLSATQNITVNVVDIKPQVSGTFNPIATDDTLALEEKNVGVTLSGTVSDPNAKVTLQFSGQFRVAKVDSPGTGISTWSYTLTSNDYNFLREGENQLTAIFTLSNNNGTGNSTTSRTLNINPGVLQSPSSPSPTLDPTQPKGITAAVTQKAESAKIGQGILGTEEKLTDPNIVVIPFGGINTFNQGANAALEDFGLIKTGSNTTIESVKVFPKSSTGEVSVTLSDGTAVLASIPPGISSIGDPLGLSMSGLVPGGSSTLDFYLPRNILNQLPNDLQSATYAKFNFDAKKFQRYADEQGKPLYQYKFTDKNSNGIRDFGELYLSLNLTDGDKWDGDRIQNGIIVDPGQLGITVAVTGTGVTYSSTTVNPGNSLIPREAPALSNIADNVFYNFSNTYKPAEARQALQNALGQTDAAFKNIFGLYEVDNATGRVNNIAPGEPGYAKAALDKSKVISNFTVRAGGSVTPNINGDLIGIGGKTYAPFVIANGGNYSGSIQEAINEFFKINPNNSAATAQNYMGLPVAYFSFGAANPDGAAHIKSFGNNIFGFEDLPAGVGVSDYDFNDMVFSFG
ncbi:MAG: esterase-like activity of phytase family protein [Cylindrospermopsis raciborskii KL1]|nr:esterase-like activity of phytase family protein [Cylindrospermopsis raciborskii KL1]